MFFYFKANVPKNKILAKEKKRLAAKHWYPVLTLKTIETVTNQQIMHIKIPSIRLICLKTSNLWLSYSLKVYFVYYFFFYGYWSYNYADTCHSYVTFAGTLWRGVKCLNFLTRLVSRNLSFMLWSIFYCLIGCLSDIYGNSISCREEEHGESTSLPVLNDKGLPWFENLTLLLFI